MAHVHIKRRPRTFHLFLECALDLVVAHAVFAHRIVLEHETFAEGVDFVRAGAVDAVHARTAEALGQHCRALVGIEFCNCGPRLVAQNQARAGVVGIHPDIEGVVGGIVRAPGGRTALGGNHCLGADNHIFAASYIPAKHAAGLAAVRQDAHGHDAVQHIDAGLAHNFGHDALDGHAVVDMAPPAARLTKALGAQMAAALVAAKTYARRPQNIQEMAHVAVPAVDQHVFRPAIEGFGIKFHKIVGRVKGFPCLVQNSHVMIVAAAYAARAFQLALVDNKHILALLIRSKGRSAAGSARTDNQNVSFITCAQRMLCAFHAPTLIKDLCANAPCGFVNKKSFIGCSLSNQLKSFTVAFHQTQGADAHDRGTERRFFAMAARILFYRQNRQRAQGG